MAKGFKKKYFSLAAITATVSMVGLQAVAASTMELQKVVVSATKSSEAIEDATEDMEIITADELQERGIHTLRELLHYISGADITSNGGAGKVSQLYLRGMNNDKVLILIDGVRFNDPSNFSGITPEHLLLDNVKRIEIIKGAQSGVWGSDAAAGVINIITNDAPHTTMKLRTGSFRTLQGALSTAQKAGDFFYALGVGYLHTDGFSAITPFKKKPTDYEADGYTNRTAHIKAGIDKNGFKAEIGAHIISAYNEADQYLQPNSRYNDRFKYHAYFSNVSQNFGSHTLALHVDKTRTHRNYPDATYGIKDFIGDTSNIELKDTLDYGAGRLTGGLGYQDFKTSYTYFVPRRISYHNRYAYAVNANRFGNLILQENIRYDAYDAFKNQWTGKVGAKYRIANAAIFANYGKAYNVPSQIKMLNPWGKPNFDLQPEKTRSYDVGIEAFGLKATYFKERVKDLINWYDPNSSVWGDEYYKNVPGTSEFSGYELTYTRAAWDVLRLTLGMQYLSPKDSSGKALPRRARHKYTYSLTWYPSDEHTVTIDGYYVGTRYDDAARTKQTGRYNVTNVTLRHHFDKNFTGFVELHNIFNRRYQEVYGYGAEPRSFYIGIEGSF